MIKFCKSVEEFIDYQGAKKSWLSTLHILSSFLLTRPMRFADSFPPPRFLTEWLSSSSSKERIDTFRKFVILFEKYLVKNILHRLRGNLVGTDENGYFLRGRREIRKKLHRLVRETSYPSQEASISMESLAGISMSSTPAKHCPRHPYNMDEETEGKKGIEKRKTSAWLENYHFRPGAISFPLICSLRGGRLCIILPEDS